MLQQKDYVTSFLVQHFNEIQEARKLNGFSWKPIVQQILAIHKDIGLDPDSEVHRNRVRNNFLNLRRRVDTPTAKLPILGQVYAPQPQNGYVERITRNDVEKFKYMDTYNVPKVAPTTEEEEFKAWKKEKDRIKCQQGMHIVIGCAHLPAVNKPFFKAFLEFLEDAKGTVKGIHLIGDILDCKALSQHDNGKIKAGSLTLQEEYDESNKYLDQIDERLAPGIEKNYIWGNHEQRYATILQKVDISKFGGALLSPTKGCKFVERGYTVQEDYTNGLIQLGQHLDLVHGVYITQNSAKKHLDVCKKSIMFAHTHKMGAYFDCDMAAFNIGWMGDASDDAFSYANRITKTQWQNGFAVVNIDEDGFYHVQLVQWYNGRFVFGTRQYKGDGSY